MNRLLVFLAALLVTSSAFAADPIRPNPKLTPGDTLNVPLSTLCTPGYANGSVKSGKKGARNVPQSEKNAVYREYGITSHKPGEFEIDHLISIELAGSNNIKNLWPESYITTPYNAHVKNKLEDRLHTLVCSGQVPLAMAQQAIRTDWIAAYQKYVESK